MVKLLVLIGIPGSGKSYYSKKLKEQGMPIVSTDGVRSKYIGIAETDVWPMVYKSMVEYLKKGEDCLFDATSTTPKVRKRLIDNIQEYSGLIHNVDYEINAYYFPTGANTCISRVEKRNTMKGELYLPLDCIYSYGSTIFPPTYNEQFAKSLVCSNVPELLEDFPKDSYHGYALYLKDPNSFDPILEEFSGFGNIETFEPIRDNSCFRLASVSKQFIAYSICTLVKDGKLSFDDKLFDMFPKMPKYTKDITIKNLLNHTSGIYDYEDMRHNNKKQVQDEDVLKWLKRKTKTTYFEIGSKYQYSNTAYVILGLIIKEKSHKSIGEYLDEIIFKPLKMNSSKVNYEPHTEFLKRAYGHVRVDGKLVKKDQYWCSATIGDGGIYSNLVDLKKWLKHIEELENMEYPYNLMVQPNIINGNNTEYGFGLRIKEINGHKIIYHNGSTIGTNTSIGFIKDLGIEFIYLINEDNNSTDKFISKLTKRYMNE